VSPRAPGLQGPPSHVPIQPNQVTAQLQVPQAVPGRPPQEGNAPHIGDIPGPGPPCARCVQSGARPLGVTRVPRTTATGTWPAPGRGTSRGTERRAGLCLRKGPYSHQPQRQCVPLLHADVSSSPTKVEVMAGAVSDLGPPPWCLVGAGCSPTCPPRVTLAVALPPLCLVSLAALSCFVAPWEQPSFASSKLRIWGDLQLGVRLSAYLLLLDPVKGRQDSGHAGAVILSVPGSSERGPPINFAVQQGIG